MDNRSRPVTGNHHVLRSLCFLCRELGADGELAGEMATTPCLINVGWGLVTPCCGVLGAQYLVCRVLDAVRTPIQSNASVTQAITVLYIPEISDKTVPCMFCEVQRKGLVPEKYQIRKNICLGTFCGLSQEY